jgi:hypothetical protein
MHRGHFAGPHLMQDLSGFGVGLGIVVGRLIGREPREDGERYTRVEPQALHGRDQSVTPERRRKPWNPRIGVRPLRGMGQ